MHAEYHGRDHGHVGRLLLLGCGERTQSIDPIRPFACGQTHERIRRQGTLERIPQ